MNYSHQLFLTKYKRSSRFTVDVLMVNITLNGKHHMTRCASVPRELLPMLLSLSQPWLVLSVLSHCLSPSYRDLHLHALLHCRPLGSHVCTANGKFVSAFHTCCRLPLPQGSTYHSSTQLPLSFILTLPCVTVTSQLHTHTSLCHSYLSALYSH